MSTATEEKPATSSGTDSLPDWAAGYALSLPCEIRVVKCDLEAEWFGNQHGCFKAHICDDHMKQCYHDVNAKIAEWGGVQCRKCKKIFPTFPAFIKAVRI